MGQTPEAKETTIWQRVGPQTQKVRQMRWQMNMFQTKEQDKTPEERLSEVEIGNRPEKEFRVMKVKMIQDLRKRMEV